MFKSNRSYSFRETRFAARPGTYPGFEECFVRIDITDADDKPIVHDQIFDRRLALAGVLKEKGPHWLPQRAVLHQDARAEGVLLAGCQSRACSQIFWGH